MKTIVKMLILMMIVGFASCSKTKAKKTEQDNPFPVKYENDLFSVNMPKGWVCDSSCWGGIPHKNPER